MALSIYLWGMIPAAAFFAWCATCIWEQEAQMRQKAPLLRAMGAPMPETVASLALAVLIGTAVWPISLIGMIAKAIEMSRRG